MSAPRFKLEDQTGQITESERQMVEKALAEASQQADVEFNVLVVDAIAERAFRKHAVEQRERLSTDYENSVLVVVDMGDRHVEIATSAKYNDLFTPTVTNRLLMGTAVPFLRKGKLVNGIVAAAQGVTGLLTRKTSAAGVACEIKRRTSLKKMALGAVMVLVIAGLIGYPFYRNHTCRNCRAWGDYRAHTVRPATAAQDGLKEHSFRCLHCKTNYHWQTSISYDDGSSSSWGSDFGGSGGGGDGGGGADF